MGLPEENMTYTDFSDNETAVSSIVTEPSYVSGTRRTASPHVVFFIGYNIIAFLILATNCMTLAAICRYKKLQTKTGVFIFGLSLADILVAPATLLKYDVLLQLPDPLSRFWPMVSLFCGKLPGILSSQCSLTTLLLIATERTVAIANPFFYKQRVTIKKCILLLLASWTITALLTGVPLIFYGMQVPASVLVYGFVGQIMPPSVYKGIFTFQRALFIGLTILLYIITFVKLYIRESKKVHIQHGNYSLSTRSLTKTKQITQMMAIVLIALLVAWAPISLLPYFSNYIRSARAYIYDVVLMILFSNSFINAFIYGWKNQHFRLAYMSLFHCKKMEVGTSFESSNSNSQRVTGDTSIEN